MPLEPRFKRRGRGIASGSTPLARIFVDREEPLAAFEAALGHPNLSSPRVLVYYGIGGIGKSRLRRELRDRLVAHEPGAVWAEVDFSLPALRDPETALFALRRQLVERQHVGFPSFDLVYAYLWKQTRPNVPPTQEGSPLFEAGSLAAKILAAVGVPLVSLVPDIVAKGQKPLKQWWQKRGRDDLAELPRLEPAEIQARLPAYFAEDLAEHLADKECRAVIFFDTHEALLGELRSEEQRLVRDEWLRELILQLPQVLFVIGGRERLAWQTLDPEWGEVLEQRELGPLPAEDCRHFLLAAALTDEAAQEAVLLEAKGLPLLLDLTLDTLQEMGPGADASLFAHAVSSDEPEVALRLAERFLRYLSPAEQDTLEVLAGPRFFDEALAADLITEFRTQLPLGQIPELVRFSFVSERTPGVYQLHDVLQECLEKRLERRNPGRRAAVYAHLFHLYDVKLEDLAPKDIGLDQEQAFLEAFFHARSHLDSGELVDWFLRRAECFVEASRYAFLTQPSEELLTYVQDKLGPYDLSVARAMAHLALLLTRLGHCDQAEELFRQSLITTEAALGETDPEVRKVRSWLGACFMEAGRYAESEEVLRACLALGTKPEGFGDPGRALTLQVLGTLLGSMGRWEEARDAYERALTIAQEHELPLKPRIMGSLAGVLLDLMYFTQADALLREILALLDTTRGRLNLDGALVLGNMGMSHLYQRRYPEAEAAICEALQILENTGNQNTRTYAAALMALAELFCEQGRLSESTDLLARVDAFVRDPFQKADNNWLKARVLLRQGQFNEAETLLAGNLTLLQKNATVVPWHWTTYQTLRAYGELCDTTGRYQEAENYYRRCVEMLEQHYRVDHPHLEGLYSDLAGLCQRQGRGDEAAVCASRAEEIRAANAAP